MNFETKRICIFAGYSSDLNKIFFDEYNITDLEVGAVFNKMKINYEK